MMTLTLVFVLWILGLVLWLVPFTGQAARLNEVGKWVFILAFAKWLGF